MRGLVLYYPPCKAECRLSVDEFRMEFSLAPEGTMVSTYHTDTLSGSHKISWGTMVTSQTLGTSTARETYLLTLGLVFQRQTSNPEKKM